MERTRYIIYSYIIIMMMIILMINLWQEWEEEMHLRGADEIYNI